MGDEGGWDWSKFWDIDVVVGGDVGLGLVYVCYWMVKSGFYLVC